MIHVQKEHLSPLSPYLDEVQHSEGEVLITKAAVHHHLNENWQRPG